MRFTRVEGLIAAWVVSSITGMAFPARSFALPPAEDVPEEILRTQIILDARSPIDGQPMTPAEYAEFQAQQQAPYQPTTPLSPKVQSTVDLLKLRHFVKRFLPFIPIK